MKLTKEKEMKLTDVLNYDLVQFGFSAADKKRSSGQTNKHVSGKKYYR